MAIDPDYIKSLLERMKSARPDDMPPTPEQLRAILTVFLRDFEGLMPEDTDDEDSQETGPARVHVEFDNGDVFTWRDGTAEVYLAQEREVLVKCSRAEFGELLVTACISNTRHAVMRLLTRDRRI